MAYRIVVKDDVFLMGQGEYSELNYATGLYGATADLDLEALRPHARRSAQPAQALAQISSCALPLRKPSRESGFVLGSKAAPVGPQNFTRTQELISFVSVVQLRPSDGLGTGR